MNLSYLEIGGDYMSVTKKEEIEQFKRDLKSLNYYKSKYDEISDKLLVVARLMHEPKANSYDGMFGNNNNYNFIELMEKEAELKKQQYLYDSLIKTIENRLDLLEKASDKDLLINIYIRKYSYEKLAMERFMSVRRLKYYVNAVIEKLL